MAYTVGNISRHLKISLFIVFYNTDKSHDDVVAVI